MRKYGKDIVLTQKIMQDIDKALLIILINVFFISSMSDLFVSMRRND